MFNKTTKNTEKLTYNQPKVYTLGSLKKVQSYADGNQTDGSSQYSYFFA